MSKKETLRVLEFKTFSLIFSSDVLFFPSDDMLTSKSWQNIVEKASLFFLANSLCSAYKF